MRSRGGNSSWAWVVGGIVALLLLTLIPPSNPDASTGGEVDEAVGPRALTIGGQEFHGRQSLLVTAIPLPVVTDRPGEAAVVKNDVIQALGPVRRFDIAELEAAIDTDLDDGLFTKYNGQPAVIGRSVDLTAPTGNARAQSVPASIANLADNPREYVGQSDTVSGRITEVVGYNAFLLSDQVLVVGSGEAVPGGSLTPGNVVQVSGEYRNFDLVAFEQELGVDLDGELFADWGNRPALLAQQIQPMQKGLDRYGGSWRRVTETRSNEYRRRERLMAKSRQTVRPTDADGRARPVAARLVAAVPVEVFQQQTNIRTPRDRVRWAQI